MSYVLKLTLTGIFGGILCGVLQLPIFVSAMLGGLLGFYFYLGEHDENKKTEKE